MTLVGRGAFQGEIVRALLFFSPTVLSWGDVSPSQAEGGVQKGALGVVQLVAIPRGPGLGLGFVR